MNRTNALKIFTFAGFVGIAFGIFYSLFGLEGLPPYRLFVPADSLQPWSRGLYGSAFIGFSVLLLCIGRYAFQKNDRHLMKILLAGISAWLVVEAGFSLAYGVYFNVLVDAAIFGFLGYPLLQGMRSRTK